MANLIAYLNAQNKGQNRKSKVPDHPKQPVIVVLTSHWITMAGVALVTLAGFSWLFALPAEHSRECQQSLHRSAGVHRHPQSCFSRD